MVWRIFHETARSMCEDQVPDEPASGHSLDCTGRLDVIRKEAWSFYRTITGVRLCEEPKGPLLDPRDLLLRSERTQGFAAGPVYSRAKCLPMLGSLKTLRTQRT